MSLLADTHLEALRTSFDGIQFNCFHRKWRLSLNRTCYLDRLYTHNFNDDFLLKILLTLGDVAENRSAVVASNVVNVLTKGEIREFSILGLKKAIAIYRSRNKSDVGLRKLKTFILALGKRYPEHNDLVAEIRSYKVRNSIPSIYDPQKGALTEYEHESLAMRIDELSSELSQHAIGETNSHILVRFRQLIIMRLLTVTVRRPTQLSMLKWCDIDVGKTSIKNEFSMTIPCAKKFNASGFRGSFEDIAIPLGERFSEELFAYKSFSYKVIKNLFDKKVDQFCPEGFNKLFEYMPILPNTELFRTGKLDIPKAFSTLKNTIGPRSSAFHVDGAGALAGTFTMLEDVASDRGIQINQTLGCQRLRHTLGSRLALKGFDNLAISNLLGNTPKAAKYYIDLLPESRDQINESITGLQVLAKRFSGQLINKADRDRAIYSDQGDVCGASKLVTLCSECTKTRPIGCYGCSNFRPLINADHMESRRRVVAVYAQYENMGADAAVLAPIRNLLKNIDLTILACDLAKQNLLLGK